MHMQRNILTEGRGRQACSQACIHTERERGPQTDIQTDTYLEIHRETEVHSQRQR